MALLASVVDSRLDGDSRVGEAQRGDVNPSGADVGAQADIRPCAKRDICTPARAGCDNLYDSVIFGRFEGAGGISVYPLGATFLYPIPIIGLIGAINCRIADLREIWIFGDGG